MEAAFFNDLTAPHREHYLCILVLLGVGVLRRISTRSAFYSVVVNDSLSVGDRYNTHLYSTRITRR